MKTPKRLEKPKERADAFLKDFEWNWTKAIVASLVITGFTLVTTVYIPSFWTYFAESELGWIGATDIEAFINDPLSAELGKQIRDAVAMGLTLGPLITILAAATIMQNWRRKLRGASDSRPTGGYK
jgi:hypothetical protein